MENNNNEKMMIEIPTRNNRLVLVYKSLQIPVKVLAGVSAITLAVALIGFTMSKIGLSDYYYIVLGVIGLLSVGLAFYWEKTITELWQEFTRQVVNWEFEGTYQSILGVIIFIIPVVMGLLSVFGSVFGGYDIAEVTAGEAQTTDINKVASSLSASVNDLESSYTKQIEELRNEKAASIATITAQHDARIKANKQKAWKVKTNGNTADYNWLIGGKANQLLNDKTKAIEDKTNHYDQLIDDLIKQKNNVVNNNQANASTVIIATNKQNNKVTNEHQIKKQRHEKGFTWLAAISSPLYFLLIFISSVIEANIGAISQNDLITEEERKKLKERQSTAKESTNGTDLGNFMRLINKANQSPMYAQDNTHNTEANTSEYKPHYQVHKHTTQNNTQPNKRAVVLHIADRETNVTRTTQHNTKRVVFNYNTTKNHLNSTYLKRYLKGEGNKITAVKGIVKRVKLLVENGYKVTYDANKNKFVVDPINKASLPEGSQADVDFENGITVCYT